MTVNKGCIPGICHPPGKNQNNNNDEIGRRGVIPNINTKNSFGGCVLI
jgi:hypothetical protein